MKKKNEEGCFVCSCGGYPSINKFGGEYRHHNDGEWDVECRGCGIEIRMCRSYEGAINAWNNHVCNDYTLETETIDALQKLMKYLENEKLPILDLSVARTIVARFLRENIQE